MNDRAVWNGYIAKGHTVRTYEAKASPASQTHETTEVDGIKALNAVKAAGVPLPAVVINDKTTGQLLKVMPMGTIPDAQTTISMLGG